MNWKTEAINDLKIYAAQKASIDNINLRIELLHEDQYSMRGTTLSPVPTHGGTSKYEDKLLDCMAEIGRLEKQKEPITGKLRLIEKGLAGLDKRERDVLDKLCINSTPGCIDKLAQEWGYDQRQIYRIRDAALYKYTMLMFGLCDY